MTFHRTAYFWPALVALIAACLFALPATAQQDNDHTLEAMQDEMTRSVQRLQIPGQQKPYYIEYRILDVDVRAITSSFGTLFSSTHERSRFMSVDVRVGTACCCRDFAGGSLGAA